MEFGELFADFARDYKRIKEFETEYFLHVKNSNPVIEPLFKFGAPPVSMKRSK